MLVNQRRYLFMGQLKIVCAQLGPIDTNTYILMDDETKEAIIIDPAGSPEELIKFLEDEGYSLDALTCFVTFLDGFADFLDVVRNLRNQDNVRTACNTCMKRKPSYLMTHYLHDKNTSV